jgi:prolyl-tRNA editing enzyme YbaK/EbsC (Cys-tRNA(Pro) deacylase)
MSTVTDHLSSEGIVFEVLTHPRAFTGIDEARALGIEADAVLKTVIVDTHGDHVALVLPAGERLDLELVREAVDDPDAALANEHELTRDFGGFELGSLPPLPRLLGIDVVVDLEVKGHGPVVFAAGSQTESVRVEASDLFANEPVRYAQLIEAWNRGRS